MYTIYLFTQGKGGELNHREEERGNRGEYRSQSWVENTNKKDSGIGYLQFLKLDKPLHCRSPESLYR
jgi:hypothetical protein